VREDLEAILAARIRSLPSADVLAALEAVKVSCARVNAVREAFGCPAVQELDQVLTCGGEGEVRFVGSPIRLDGEPHPPFTPPPALGEDDEEIRRRRDW